MAAPEAERKRLQEERKSLLAAQASHADRQKLDRLARSNSCVRELIDEYERLRTEVAKFKQSKSK
jgi:hypothetical protein